MLSKASHTTQDTVNQEENPREPRPTIEQPGEQPHHPHQKAQMCSETNPHQPKARQTVGEHQKLIYHTLDWWRPIPTHTNTPITGSAATPVPTPNGKKKKQQKSTHKGMVPVDKLLLLLLYNNNNLSTGTIPLQLCWNIN